MLHGFGAVVAENVKMAGWPPVPKYAMTKPPRLSNPQLETLIQESRDVRLLIIGVCNDKIDVDNGLCREHSNSS